MNEIKRPVSYERFEIEFRAAHLYPAEVLTILDISRETLNRWRRQDRVPWWALHIVKIQGAKDCLKCRRRAERDMQRKYGRQLAEGRARLSAGRPRYASGGRKVMPDNMGGM